MPGSSRRRISHIHCVIFLFCLQGGRGGERGGHTVNERYREEKDHVILCYDY